MFVSGHARPSRRRLPPGVEPLEERRLLSVVAPTGSKGQALTVQPPPLEVRKNAATLTQPQIDAFVDAIKTLKTTYREGSSLSVYDEFVQEHADAFASHQAHGGPAFLPWHREFLLQFEQALQSVDPTVTIPYWDFTADNSPTSYLWSKDFLGGNGDPSDDNIVKDGPFAEGRWTLVLGDSTALRRDFGDLQATLPTAADVRAAFGATRYDVYPYDVGSPDDQSFRNSLEGFNHLSGEPELHNRVHNWIGGSMAIQYSPNDPVFWILHADIDRLWAQWEDANPGDLYDPETGAAYGHNLFDPMSPFGVTPANVLDERALGYVYDTQAAADFQKSGGGATLVTDLAALEILHALHLDAEGIPGVGTPGGGGAMAGGGDFRPFADAGGGGAWWSVVPSVTMAPDTAVMGAPAMGSASSMVVGMPHVCF